MHVFNRLRIQLTFWSALVVLLLITEPLLALPIGFGIRQGNMEYQELVTDHFYLYHDSRAPTEAQALINSFAAARPIMETWFDQKRDRWLRSGQRRLPIVVSTVTANASFANLIFDNIELQTLGLGDRDLAWHEYTHSTMYQRLDNFLGPSGTVYHLFYMPAWYIEGLAETLSVSIGSDTQAGIERYQALTGSWPSFERIHSLYDGSAFARRGYATAGGFVNYLMRTTEADDLPRFLDQFYWNTVKPWWIAWEFLWPLEFTVFDGALSKFAGDVATEELYEQYQKAAKAHWEKSSTGRFLLEEEGARRNFTGLGGLRVSPKGVHQLFEIDGVTYDAVLEPDQKTGWVATKFDQQYPLPKDNRYGSRLDLGKRILSASYIYNQSGTNRESMLVVTNRKGTKRRDLLRRNSVIERLWAAGNQIYWMEHAYESVRVCSISKKNLFTGKKLRRTAGIKCYFEAAYPTSLTYLGESFTKKGDTETLWFRKSVDTVVGNRHEVLELRPAQKKLRRFKLDDHTKPLRVMQRPGGQFAFLIAGHNRRYLRFTDSNGTCKGQVKFDDHLVELLPVGSKDAAMFGLYAGGRSQLRVLPLDQLKVKKCAKDSGHISPLIAALRADGQITFSEAVERANLWSAPTKPLSAGDAKVLASRVPLDEDDLGEGHTKESRPAEYRWAPAFAWPWIGGDDPQTPDLFLLGDLGGSQIGFLSIPFLDDLQNDRIDYMALWGIESTFPHQRISFSTSRFKPVWRLTATRQPTWDGIIFDRQSRQRRSVYYDEKSAELETGYAWLLFGRHVFDVGLGIKHGHLKTYLGIRPGIPEGTFTEFNTNLSLSLRLSWVSWSNRVSYKSVPEAVNPVYDYNQFDATTTMSFSFWSTSLSLGAEMGRTRGAKPRNLKEFYQPLKTFVPGSGGGFNQQTTPLFNTSTNEFLSAGFSSLFSSRYGDNQARVRTNYIVPLVRSPDILFWTFYLQRLDMSMFYNRGNTWRGEFLDLPENMIDAAGLNFDLTAENRGMNVNFGVGVGSVINNAQGEGEGDLVFIAKIGFDDLLQRR